MTTDRVLYCVGPGRDWEPGGCGREVAGHGADACETHLKQLSRTGKMVPIAEKVSPKEHLLNLYNRLAEADSDKDYETAERAFFTQVKAMGKSAPSDEEIDELVKKAISSATRRRMAAAKARGVHVGRPRRVDRQEVERLLALTPVELVALLLKASKRTIYAAVQKGPLAAKPPRSGSPRAARE